jgi:ABC-type oligopeptide transport system substrate-binding subunit
MTRRLWLSLAMLAAGGGMLAASAFGSSSLKQGGIFRVGMTGASVQMDPQVGYVTTAWWLEYATAAKLFNWPDRPGPLGNRLVPEVAASFSVSNHGRTYTFFIRPGFRFSDGTPVTAKSFAYAFDRVANHDLASPGAQFITDPNGTNIVGAKAVNDGGSPWTHLLPPGSPGSISTRKLQPYSPGPNIAKARRLAKGHFKDGKVHVYYPGTGTIRPAQAQVVRHDLIRLGFKPENVITKGFYCELGPCFPADWDIGVGSGWCTDYPDPYDVFLPFFFTGELDTYPFIDSAKYRAKIKADAKLVGNARLRAFGRLDLEIMNKLAPVAVMRTYNNRYFFSHRVNPGSLSYQGVYSAWSIPALALK